MSRRVCDELNSFHEGHGFLRGMVAYVGFHQTFIEYGRAVRHAGRAHYNRLIGSLKIGLNGLISFSSRPLQMMSIVGFLVAGFSFLLGTYYVIGHFVGLPLTAGLPTTVLVVTFFSGVQLLSLVCGRVRGSNYDEVKRRPTYIIESGTARPKCPTR